MSARDTAPYLEETGKRPDGTPILTWHNLAPSDIILIRDLLSAHRSRNVVVLTEGDGFTNPHERTRIALEKDRIDDIKLNSYPRA